MTLCNDFMQIFAVWKVHFRILFSLTCWESEFRPLIFWCEVAVKFVQRLEHFQETEGQQSEPPLQWMLTLFDGCILYVFAICLAYRNAHTTKLLGADETSIHGIRLPGSC